MKKFYLVALAIIGIYACLNFSSCSKDDESEQSSNTLPDVLIGTWEQDDDDDIYVINKDGSGKLFTDHDMDLQKHEIEWKYENGYIILDCKGLSQGYIDQYYKLVPKKVSKDEIVWDWYGITMRDNDGTWEKVGDYEYWDEWTWTRYK